MREEDTTGATGKMTHKKKRDSKYEYTRNVNVCKPLPMHFWGGRRAAAMKNTERITKRYHAYYFYVIHRSSMFT